MIPVTNNNCKQSQQDSKKKKMHHKFLLLLLIVSIISVTCCATKSVTLRVINKAISDMLQDETTQYGWTPMFIKTFGDVPSMFPDVICTELDWPAKQELTQDALWKKVFDTNIMMYGANSVSNIPKRFNYTSISHNPEYGTVIGWEADIANSITYRIAQHYQVTLHAYWSKSSSWYSSKDDNIIASLYKEQFDFILSGMSFNSTWNNPNYNSTVETPNEPAMVPREQLVDFTCTYQDGGYGVVMGPLALPNNSIPINSVKNIDQPGIVVCVQSDTTMETIARSYLSLVNVTDYVNGPVPRDNTINGVHCHMYIAPIINALVDGRDIAGLKYLGMIGPKDVAASEAVAVAVRKETLIPGDSSSDSTITTSSMLFTVIIVIIMMLLV
jgi:ABC-type amino acid transport substrate-binding protein